MLRHRHDLPDADDLARQPLLPRRLNSRGPGVAWIHLGSGSGGAAADSLLVTGAEAPTVFRNDGKGLRQPARAPSTNRHAESTASVAFVTGDGSPHVVRGQFAWTDSTNRSDWLHIAPVNTDEGPPPVRLVLPGRPSVPGPVSLADVDGDGVLDLFVGGHFVPGRYPEAADSHLLRGSDGTFRPLQHFPGLGLVSGSVFTDWDGDGDPDLALACEWGPLRLLRNDGGRWVDVSAALGLLELQDRWNGIQAGDFDGDGRLDLVASNWGRNWRLDIGPAPSVFPVVLAYGEFAEDGIVHPLLASLDPALGFVTPWRDRESLARVIPSLAARAPSRRTFAKTPLGALLGSPVQPIPTLSASFFDSVVLLNRGDRVDVRPLPPEAQFSPAFGVAVADFDGNGTEDLFLAQNFLGSDAETARHDAGLGLLLRGDGTGTFRAVPPAEAGIRIVGEQRGAAVGDLDADGRPDIAVGVAGGPVRLLRNRRAAPALRVRLRGPAGNPTSVGATVRLRFQDHLGPAREHHAGAGYWSQDSPILLLATPRPPVAAVVRWPGGRQDEYPIPAGARFLEVSPQSPRP